MASKMLFLLLSFFMLTLLQAAPLEPSPGWKLAADIIKETLNTSVKPCDNFYKFACEGYLATHKGKNTLGEMQVEANANMTKAFDSIQELADKSTSKTLRTAAKLHQACKDFQGTVGGVKLQLDIAKEYGGWPIIEPNWTIDQIPNGLFNAIGDIFSTYGLGALFDARVVLRLEKPVLRLEPLTAVSTNPQKPALEQQIYNLVKKLDPNANDNVVKPQVSRIADIEIKLAQISADHADEDDTAGLSVDEAQKQYPAIQWLNLFKGFLEGVFEGDLSEYLKLFQLRKPALVKELNQYLAELESSPSTIKDAVNYLIYKLLDKTPNFDGLVQSESQQTFEGQEASLLKNAPFTATFVPVDECTREVNDLIPGLRDRLYLELSFPRQHLEDVNQMMTNILAAFRKSLASLTWLDKESLERSQKKVDTVSRKLGHPKWLVDEPKFDALQGCLNKHILSSKSNDPLTAYKYIKLGLCQKGQGLRQLDPIEKDDFRNYPVNEINAHYVYALNQIILPAGILHTPLYRYDFPQAINYGGAGMVIGHELNHGYDKNGVDYDHNGDRNPILTPSSRTEFQKIVDCVQTIYRRLGGSDVIDQNQNIADSAGIKAAYRAFKKLQEEQGEESPLPGLEEYSWDQIFMIAQGRTWCGSAPGRVNGEFQNFDKFSEIFQCKVGDFMRPADACDVW